MKNATETDSSTSSKKSMHASEQQKGPTQLRWLEGQAPQVHGGTAFGVPWPMGQHAANSTFALRTAQGQHVPIQSWPMATWPDGSLKWTGHALAPDAPSADFYEIVPGKPSIPSKPVCVEKTSDAIIVATGVIQCQLPLKGESLIETVKRGDTIILRNGHLTGMRQDSPDRGTKTEVFSTVFRGFCAHNSPIIFSCIICKWRNDVVDGLI